jgi:hypothetical protein
MSTDDKQALVDALGDLAWALDAQGRKADSRTCTSAAIWIAGSPEYVSCEEVIEACAKECDTAAAYYRSLQVAEDGTPTDEAPECEEMAYCCDLNAKRIRALKESRRCEHGDSSG